MKKVNIKILSSLFLMIVLLYNYSCVTKSNQKVQLGQTSVVNFSFINVTDSIKLNLYNFPVLNSSKFNETTFISPEKKEQQFTLPCECPTSINVFVGDQDFKCVITPGNLLQIMIELSDSSKINDIKFTGETNTICEYYYSKQQKLGFNDNRVPLNNVSSEPDDILQNTDSIMNLELNYLKNYQNKFQLPDWFIQTEENEIIYGCSSFKYSMESYVTKYLHKDFKPSPQYFEFLDTLKIDNPKAIYSYWYYYFLKNYLVHKRLNLEGLETKEWMDLTTKTALENSETNLSNLTRDIFNYNYLYTYLHWTKNLNDFDVLYKKYAQNFTNKEFPLEIEKFRKTLTDSVVENRNDELHETPKKSINANDSVPYFYLPDVNGNYFSTNNFKDKILYLNIWATWCKPCIASIPDKNKLIGEFQNNGNIVFLNICILSPKDDWEKTLTDKNLKGINLFANENWSGIIEQNFSAEGVPSYYLIKNGKIIKPFCDSPLNIKDDIEFLIKN